MKLLDFPSRHIDLALSLSDRIEMLEFSIYDSRRGSEEHARRVFRTRVADLTKWWSSTVPNLTEYEEIGLNSRVKILGQKEFFHIPMIDLKGGVRLDLERIEKFLCAECPEVLPLQWFSSGRSFHAYGATLLSNQQWRYFMETLLLYRSQESSIAIDTRWVGHRLRAGYACLRLTMNTAKYVDIPKLLELPTNHSRRTEAA